MDTDRIRKIFSIFICACVSGVQNTCSDELNNFVRIVPKTIINLCGIEPVRSQGVPYKQESAKTFCSHCPGNILQGKYLA